MTFMVFVRQLIGLRPQTDGLAPAQQAGWRRLAYGVLPVALLCYLIAAYAAYFGFGADDAWIVARYARNVIAGHGLVFNPGDTVSALTSPFHAIVMAGLTAVTDRPVFAYKMISIALVTATLGWMSVRLLPEGPQRIAFLILTAASPFVVLWTAGGLETPLLLGALGLFCAAAWRDDRSPAAEPGSVAVYFLAALAFLIRHDSALLTAPVVAHQILVNRHSLRQWAALLVAAIAPFGWLLFSAVYYGDMLPTSFYWKRPVFGWNVITGLIYLLSFLTLSGALLALFAGRRPSWSRAAGLRRNRPILIGLALFVAYATTAGIVHMMFSYRIYVPIIPIVMLVAFSLARSFELGARSAALAALALLLQVALSLVIYTSTINPTVLHAFGGGAPRLFEYSRIGLASYADDFLPAMTANATETRDDWLERGPHDRLPRIHTFAAGVLPYRFEDTYIFDSLSSYRHGCDREWTYWRRAADYMHIMWPRQGSPEEQLGRLAEQAELVSRRVILFDGEREHLDVYFNPRPDPIRNSDRIDRPC